MSGEDFFLENRAEIERAVRFVASRARLSPEDADELLSNVNLHLIENDYRVIRKFHGNCAFGTYVVVIARHVLADERMHVSGRFRPSAEAKRLGEPAILLETLLHRQHLTLEEAVAAVQQQHPLTREQLLDIARRLPERAQRARVVPIEDELEPAVGSDSVEEQAIDRERAARATEISGVVKKTIAQFPLNDRVAFQLRWKGVSVADISRMQHRDQKQLYRRLDQVAHHVRKVLLGAGVTADEIRELTDGTGVEFDFGLDEQEIAPPCQPKDTRDSGNPEVPE